MTRMKNITTMGHNQCMHQLPEAAVDFKIPTDNQIEHSKPEIVVLDKIEWKCQIIDVVCLSDTRMKDKGEVEI